MVCDSHVTAAETESSRRTLGFWAIAASITILVLGADAPLPLLTIYQEDWHFTTATLTVIYAVYTAGVVAAVFFFFFFLKKKKKKKKRWLLAFLPGFLPKTCRC